MQTGKSKVHTWFVVYCILMCLIFALVMLLGYTGQLNAHPIYPNTSLVFFIIYLIAIFLRPSPGAWVYDLVLICFGMVACCCLPIALPLFIFWINPETKSYFGRQ
jgi:hypothetical protein